MGYPINEKLISHNRSGERLNPQGFVIHSTATPGATDEREQSYFDSADRSASAHYFVDWDSITRCIPENEVAWHSGRTSNHKFLSVEMCEPAGHNEQQFQEVWNRTVWLVANACVRYGWNTKDDVWSHNGISNMWHETTHTDPYGFLQGYGRTWNQLLAAIDAEIVNQKNPQPAPTPIPVNYPTPQPKPTPSPAPKVITKFTYPNNAKCVNDDLYIRDVNGDRLEGRYVAKGDNITVLEINNAKQLVLVQYPTSNGVRAGWVKNVPSCIQYYYQDQWHNGSTPEPTLDDKGVKIGSLNPRETATPLYRRSGKLKVIYDTSVGQNSKTGYVAYNGGFSRF